MNYEVQHADRYISASWPAPDNICAVTTTRNGGVSEEGKGYISLNLSLSSGDNSELVKVNRQRIIDDCGWSYPPVYLKQVHGTHVVDSAECDAEPEADASISRMVGIPAMVMTADCLPVLFCNESGSCVAAAHAGWKGLLAGVLENTVAAMDCSSLKLMAWLGPAISQPCFEVGPEVRDAFVDANAEAEKGFIPGDKDRWLADLYLLARQRLTYTGITRVYGGTFCTFTQDELFFSYRRDGKASGRMASAIWVKES
ncbi:MAG: peptidoglycan editing factor PgeF [Candidatus Endonucleobacter sp. (ex Gigantidas childressi)]|nr:peptidoglycan editing factor PgeF [Candidatus Endonucleobacter sp. (ex Gigantidas childressi)]